MSFGASKGNVDPFKGISRAASNSAPGTQHEYSKAQGDQPIRLALSVERIGDHYSCVKYTLQGDRVLKVEIDEPNSKAIATDCFKIAAQQQVLDK